MIPPTKMEFQMSIRGSGDVSYWLTFVLFAFACLLCYVIGIQAGLSE